MRRLEQMLDFYVWTSMMSVGACLNLWLRHLCIWSSTRYFSTISISWLPFVRIATTVATLISTGIIPNSNIFVFTNKPARKDQSIRHCVFSGEWHEQRCIEGRAVWWRHDMETLYALLALHEGNPLGTVGFPSQNASNVELIRFIPVSSETEIDEIHKRSISCAEPPVTEQFSGIFHWRS